MKLLHTPNEMAVDSGWLASAGVSPGLGDGDSGFSVTNNSWHDNIRIEL